MPDYICEELEDAGIECNCHTEMDTVIPQLDTLHDPSTEERFDESEYAHIKSAYVLNAKLLEKHDNLKVLHPLHVSMKSRLMWINKHAYYFEKPKMGSMLANCLLLSSMKHFNIEEAQQ